MNLLTKNVSPFFCKILYIFLSYILHPIKLNCIQKIRNIQQKLIGNCLIPGWGHRRLCWRSRWSPRCPCTKQSWVLAGPYIVYIYALFNICFFFFPSFSLKVSTKHDSTGGFVSLHVVLVPNNLEFWPVPIYCICSIIFEFFSLSFSQRNWTCMSVCLSLSSYPT